MRISSICNHDKIVSAKSGYYPESQDPWFNHIFCGSFNPLHKGHLNIIHFVEENIKDSYVLPEITINSYDKETNTKEFSDRAKQFELLARPYVVCDTPSFLHKSFIYIHCTFIVGIDTLLRVNNSKYYLDCESEKLRAFHLIQANGCRFLVVPRYDDISGEIKTLQTESKSLSPILLSICSGLENFTPINISSTQIRSQS